MQYGGPVLVDEETGEGRLEVQGTNKRKRRNEVIGYWNERAPRHIMLIRKE